MMRVRKIRIIVVITFSFISLIVFHFKWTPNNGNTFHTGTERAMSARSVGLLVLRKEESYNLSRIRRDSSYLMALSYHEQLNTAIRYELFSLAPVAADWGLKLVEPFVVNSRIYGVKDKRVVPISDRDGLQTALPLTSLFDVNDLLMNCTNVTMAPFDMFIRNVPKRMILLYPQSRSHQAREIGFSASYGDLESNFHATGTDITDCTDVFRNHKETKTFIEVMEASFKSAKRLPKVDRVVCFNPDVPLNTSEFQSYFDTLQDTVVVLMNWRGCFIFDCSIKSYNRWLRTGECSCPNGNNNPNKNRYRLITRSALTNYEKCTEQPVPHPKEMIQTANEYLDLLNKSRPLIGIHLRIERLTMSLNVKWPKCFMRTLRPLVSKLIKQHSIVARELSKHLLVMSDFNPRGSDTCHYNNCDVASQYILNWVYREWNVRPTVFKPELAGTSTNKGYVSLVEMTMLTNVDYLVLVGHGNFQEQLASHFLSGNKHPQALHWLGRDNMCTLSENITHI